MTCSVDGSTGAGSGLTAFGLTVITIGPWADSLASQRTVQLPANTDLHRGTVIADIDRVGDRSPIRA